MVMTCYLPWRPLASLTMAKPSSEEAHEQLLMRKINGILENFSRSTQQESPPIYVVNL